MKKVKAYIAMSLDGYIADIRGGVSFLGGDNSDNNNLGSYPEFIKTIDTVILGYSTYHQIITELSVDEWAYKGMKSIVLTHKELKNTDDVVFTSQELSSLILKVKQEALKDIWVCGGASTIQQLHEKGLIDEYTISIIPTILGNGIRLFKEVSFETKLKLVSTRTYNGITDLVYEKR